MLWLKSLWASAFTLLHLVPAPIVEARTPKSLPAKTKLDSGVEASDYVAVWWSPVRQNVCAPAPDPRYASHTGYCDKSARNLGWCRTGISASPRRTTQFERSPAALSDPADIRIVAVSGDGKQAYLHCFRMASRGLASQIGRRYAWSGYQVDRTWEPNAPGVAGGLQSCKRRTRQDCRLVLYSAPDADNGFSR